MKPKSSSLPSILQAEQEGRSAALTGKPRWKHPYHWVEPIPAKDKKVIVAAFHRGYDKYKKKKKSI